MAEEIKKVEETADIASKTPELEETAPVAPTEDETTGEGEAPEVEDLDEVLMLLNIMDKQTGGSGGISEIPDELKGSIKYLIETLIFVRDIWEDPDWKMLIDDMADQREDGATPSVMVAIARNIPIEKLQELADSEDYAGAQASLVEGLDAAKATEEEDAMYEENFAKSQQAGQEYATEMGYDEEETNALFQTVFELFKVFGDGIITKEEYAKIDKMRNFDSTTQELQEQIGEQETKEVLPDMPSVDTSSRPSPMPSQSSQQGTPGMASLNYGDSNTDITQIGKRKRTR